MSDFDRFSAGYVKAAIQDAEGIWRTDPRTITVDDETSERMLNEAARFYDSHWHTLRNLIKRGLDNWEHAGELLYKARSGRAGFYYNRPGVSDRAREESEQQATKLDQAVEKMKPFRLKAKPSGHITGEWG
jgi:hypothetical protein